MICPKCGAQMSDGASFCGRCGTQLDTAPGSTGSGAPKINGVLYMVLSIAELLFCCWPTAIPAIVYSAKLLSCRDRGDDPGVRQNTGRARLWLIISAVAGIVVTAVYAIVIAAMYSNGMLDDSLAGLMSM